MFISIIILPKESYCLTDQCPNDFKNFKEFIKPLSIFQQTTEYTCGPAVLLSILKTRHLINEKLTDVELGKKIGTNAEVGTSPVAMLEGLKLYGAEGKIQFNNNPAVFFKNLDPKRIYILLIMDGLDTHWVALAGHKMNFVYLMDPYKNHNSLRRVSLCYLLANWQNVKFDEQTTYHNLSIEVR